MFKLRPYQEEGVEACVKVMTASKKKGIVVAPTGAGKSLYISKTIEKLDVPVVILQPSKELLKQNYLKYIKSGGKASIYCASLKTKTKNKKNYTVVEGKEVRCDEISKVTYATIGSIIKDINKLKKIGVKHIIVDEVHLQSKVGSQMRTFIKALGATNVLGLTATPIYLQGGMEGSRLIMINRSFGTMFRDIVHVTQIKELVDTGFWTPLKYKIIKTDESSLSLNTSGSDYTEHSQREYYESNNLKEQIVEEVNRLKKEGRKKILVFVPSILEAEQLYGLIPNSAVVHSKLSTKERDFMVDAFTNGDIPVVINVNVLATGYDNPEIDAIITSRPTSSIAIFYQQIGRGCRLHEDKEDCMIVDFSGNTNRFGRVENIEFCEIPNYGWGMFGEGGKLLSDYPIMQKIRPTKESLAQDFKRKEEVKLDWVKEQTVEPSKLYFGKHKGKTVETVYKEDKNYLMWIVEMYSKGEWTFYGETGKKLKKEIFEKLALPV